MAAKYCVICGKEFYAPPSGRVTCSQECFTKFRSTSHVGVSNVWSDEARDRLRSAPSPNLKKGTAASMLLPESQKGPQNRESQVWEIISPSGELFVAVGLSDWARKNAWRFGETEDTAHRIATGFRQVAACMRGKTIRSVPRYKGWRLNGLPVEKDDYFSKKQK